MLLLIPEAACCDKVRKTREVQMPISPLDIISSHAFDSTKHNKFTDRKLAVVIEALISIGAVRLCGTCDGKGWVQPAYAVPSCEACAGSGLIVNS